MSRQPTSTTSKHRRVTDDRKQLRVVRTGHKFHPWEDVYHLLLTLGWGKFWAIVILGYGVANLIFACLYLIEPGGIANAQPGSFTDAFFFSVQTIATIGYGAMHPVKPWTQFLTAIEALVGLMGFSGATGLMFARFSRPTARVRFSRSILMTSHQGQPTLMFRMANRRQNQIIEAQVRVVLIEDTITTEGQYLRKLTDLQLQRSQSPMFALSWLVMHAIDANSPLYGRSLESFHQKDAMFVVSLTGLDDEMSQTVHARHLYTSDDLLENYQFVDILSRDVDGAVRVDYRLFDDVHPNP